MVGGEALRLALAEPTVASVTTIGRRPTGLEHPKLRELVHADFGDCAAIAADLRGQDAGLFCLGVYTGSVPDDELRRITVDYVVRFGRALAAQSPGLAFCLLSGQGADPTEKSRLAFARYKGMAENALLEMAFERVHLFRPGYIYPVTPRAEPNVSYRVMRSLWPLAGRVWPNLGIDSTDLARVMLHVALHGTPEHGSPVLENRDIRRIARALA